jgi:hypothetical protein
MTTNKKFLLQKYLTSFENRILIQITKKHNDEIQIAGTAF